MKKTIYKVIASFEFEVDMSDFDPKHVNLEGVAKELTKNEVDTLTAEDFKYEVEKIEVLYE